MNLLPFHSWCVFVSTFEIISRVWTSRCRLWTLVWRYSTRNQQRKWVMILQTMMISDIITEKSRCWFNANPGDDHFIKISQRNYGCKKSIGLFLSLGSLLYHQCYHPHVPDSLSEYLSKLSEVSLQNQIYFPLFSLILWYSFSKRASLSLSSKPKIKMCLIII